MKVWLTTRPPVEKIIHTVHFATHPAWICPSSHLWRCQLAVLLSQVDHHAHSKHERCSLYFTEFIIQLHFIVQDCMAFCVLCKLRQCLLFLSHIYLICTIIKLHFYLILFCCWSTPGSDRWTSVMPSSGLILSLSWLSKVIENGIALHSQHCFFWPY